MPEIRDRDISFVPDNTPENKAEKKIDPKASAVSKAANPVNKEAESYLAAEIKSSDLPLSTQTPDVNVSGYVQDVRQNVDDRGYLTHQEIQNDNYTENVTNYTENLTNYTEAENKSVNTGEYSKTSSYTNAYEKLDEPGYVEEPPSKRQKIESRGPSREELEAMHKAQAKRGELRLKDSEELKMEVLSPEEQKLANQIEKVFGEGAPETKEAALKAAIYATRFRDLSLKEAKLKKTTQAPVGFTTSYLGNQNNKKLELMFLAGTKDLGEEFSQVFAMKEMASGNFKSMSKAVDLSTNKVYSAVSFKQSAKPEEIKKELEAFEKVKDVKGCIRVKNIAASNGEYVWLTPFCDGGTLGNYLKTAAPSPEHTKKMLYFFSDVSGTVSQIHDKNMIHKDLHSGNLMWKSTKNPAEGAPDNMKAKVIDYGELQSVTMNSKTGMKQTSEGGRAHPGYASPEYWKFLDLATKFIGKKKINPNDPEINTLRKQIEENFVGTPHDVWILGVTMYESFNLKPPPFKEGVALGEFPSATKIQEMRPKMEAGYPEPSEKKSVDHLIWEMLRPNPADRPTMQQVNARLEELKKAA